MSDSENTGILGISLVEDQLRIVEGIKESDEKFQITQIAQGRSRGAFDHEVFSDNNVARRFAEDIMRLYESQHFDIRRAAFSLGSDMVLVKKLSVDSGLEQDYLRDHVQWEVEQFAISPTDEYIIDFEDLDTSLNGGQNNLLVVVVRKKIVQFLKQVFKHTDLKLGVVDVDVFSAQRALQINYDYGQADAICLVNIEETKIHFSILKGRHFYLTQEVPIPPNEDGQNPSDAVVRLIAKELRRIVLDHQLGRRVEDLSEIYLYGEAVDDAVLEGLQGNYDVHIERANPFRKIKLLTQGNDDISNVRAERYMISVGAALRGIQ